MLVERAFRSVRFLAIFDFAHVMPCYFIRSSSKPLADLRITSFVVRMLSRMSFDFRGRSVDKFLKLLDFLLDTLNLHAKSYYLLF